MKIPNLPGRERRPHPSLARIVSEDSQPVASPPVYTLKSSKDS